MSRLSSFSAWVLQPLLVLAVLVIGFLAASQLSMKREPPQRAETVEYAPLVRTRTVQARSFPVLVRGNGTMAARTRIDLVSQVGGEVIEIHPGLRAGGRFDAEEVLARIEPRDYELAVASAEAEVSAAETQVLTIAAESEAATEEWKRLRPDEPVPSLVGLEPQAREADARVLAAKAQLESSRLALERTRVSLPFAGRVVSTTIDVGQVITANQAVGEVYATDVFEIAVPLRLEEVAWLHVPNEDSTGSSATVSGIGPSGSFAVEGRIARTRGELDGASRLASVIVEIATESLDQSVVEQLLPGIFVDVELEGSTMTDVVELPRSAVREGGVIWIVVDDRLQFAHPDVVRAADGSVFVRGIDDGQEVILSNLEVVSEGMRIRRESKEQP